MNLTYEPIDNLLVRFGASRAMARPSLANLSPSVSQITVPSVASPTSGLAGGTIQIGNTKVSPYRSSNLDLAVEWYFRQNSILSIAVFDKEISSFPQLVTFSANLPDVMSADAITALRAQLTPQQLNYLDGGNPFAARQVRDAPGGYLRGIEFNFQTDFWFLPGFLKNFGFQLNATKIKSSLNYILDPGVVSSAGVVSVAPTYGKGPWLNASPEAVNFTFYYQDKKFSARTSLAWRSDYYATYPLAAGSCAPGSAAGAALTTAPCTSPIMNDFGSAKGGLNVDGVVTYSPVEFLTFRLEGLNLTNKPDQRYAYVANPQVTNYASS